MINVGYTAIRQTGLEVKKKIIFADFAVPFHDFVS